MKNAVIKNEFDGLASQVDKLDRKYLRFVKEYNRPDSIAESVFEALKSKDIEQIEVSLSVVSNNMRSNLLLIGLSCLIIERENLYRKAGFRSYLEYSGRLFEKLEMAPQTLSDAKNIMAAYIDHYKGLSKHDFKLGRNAHKLRFLDEAFANHSDENEIYEKAANATFKEFVDWARVNRKKALPPTMPRVMIKDGKIYVEGRKYEELPDNMKKTIEEDIGNIYAIRSGGNEPVVTPVYDQREARALRKSIDILLKQIREKK
jgi:hypothetical protein